MTHCLSKKTHELKGMNYADEIVFLYECDQKYSASYIARRFRLRGCKMASCQVMKILRIMGVKTRTFKEQKRLDRVRSLTQKTNLKFYGYRE